MGLFTIRGGGGGASMDEGKYPTQPTPRQLQHLGHSAWQNFLHPTLAFGVLEGFQKLGSLLGMPLIMGIMVGWPGIMGTLNLGNYHPETLNF